MKELAESHSSFLSRNVIFFYTCTRAPYTLSRSWPFTAPRAIIKPAFFINEVLSISRSLHHHIHYISFPSICTHSLIEVSICLNVHRESTLAKAQLYHYLLFALCAFGDGAKFLDFMLDQHLRYAIIDHNKEWSIFSIESGKNIWKLIMCRLDKYVSLLFCSFIIRGKKLSENSDKILSLHISFFDFPYRKTSALFFARLFSLVHPSSR